MTEQILTKAICNQRNQLQPAENALDGVSYKSFVTNCLRPPISTSVFGINSSVFAEVSFGRGRFDTRGGR